MKNLKKKGKNNGFEKACKQKEEWFILYELIARKLPFKFYKFKA